MDFKLGDSVIVISKVKEVWKVNKSKYEILDLEKDTKGRIEVAIQPNMFVNKGEKRSRKYPSDIFKWLEKEEAQKECDRRNDITKGVYNS